MSRTKQRLINYHSNGPLAAVQSALTANDVALGEILVIHNSTEPLLGIRVGAGDEDFAWFIDSASVVTAISNASSNVNNSISSLSGAVIDLKDYVGTSAATHTEVANASGAAVTAANGYTDEKLTGYYTSAQTDNKIETLSGNVYTEITGITNNITSLNNNINSVSGNLETLSGQVVNNYATKEFVGAASAYSLTEAKSYSDTLSANVYTELTTNYATSADTKAAIDAVDGRVTGLNTNLGVLSGQVETLSGSVVSFSSNVKTYIDTQLGTVYKVKGTVEDYTALTKVSDPQVGDVYNVVAASGTLGTAGYVPAGTNYVYNDEHNWDALGGTIDLSSFATSSDLQDLSGSVESHISTSNTKFSNLSGAVETLSGQVVNNYATKEFVGAASGYAYNQATAYTNTVSGNVYTELTTNYATSANTYNAINAVDTRVTNVNNNVNTLSGNVETLSSATQTIEETANESISAVTTGVVDEPDNDLSDDNANASGVKIKNDNENRGVTFDFSELIIDCGDF